MNDRPSPKTCLGVAFGEKDSIAGAESLSDRFVLDDDGNAAASSIAGELARLSALDAEGVSLSPELRRHHHSAMLSFKSSSSTPLQKGMDGSDHDAVRSWAVQQSQQRMELEKGREKSERHELINEPSSPKFLPDLTPSTLLSAPHSPVLQKKTST